MAKTNKTKAITTKVVVGKTTTIDAPNPIKSIEHVAENGGTSERGNQPKAFLTKKKVILTIVFLLISIGFAVITVRPILHVNWKAFNVSVGTGISQNIGWLWLFLLLLQVFINLNRGFFTFIPRLKKWGYKISYKDYMLYSITNTFLASISPGNIVSDPYTIFWLKTHGVTTSDAVSIFFTNSLFWQIAQIFVTLPFFIICCIDCNRLISKSPLDAWLFSMICIGVIIDFVGLIFIFLLNWSKSFHYFCSKVFNWFKKKFHMKYHTKKEIKEKYKEKAVLKQSFYASLKDWKTSLYILCFWILGDALGLLSLVWCLKLVQNTIIYSGGQYHMVCVGFDFWKALLCARLAGPANRLNILPGAAMGYPAALMELLNVYGGWKVPQSVIGDLPQLQKDTISNSLVAGQIIIGWAPSIIGIAGFIVLTKQQIKLSNQGKLFGKK